MRIVFLTGAGISAESGIPTFRDAHTGLWARHDPQQLATNDAFHRDPALVWGWYRWRAARVAAARPNAGHQGIAALSDTHHVTVVTQNVDDLHERAGSNEVLHLHGSLFASRCIACGHVPTPDPMTLGLAHVDAAGKHEAPPHCPTCGGLIRPGVVWFGEDLPTQPWQGALDAVIDCDLLVVIGTSGLVHPAAQLPAVARRAGVRIIEINPQLTPLSPEVDDSWRLGAGDGLLRLREFLENGYPSI